MPQPAASHKPDCGANGRLNQQVGILMLDAPGSQGVESQGRDIPQLSGGGSCGSFPHCIAVRVTPPLAIRCTAMRSWGEVVYLIGFASSGGTDRMMCVIMHLRTVAEQQLFAILSTGANSCVRQMAVQM